MVCRFGCWRLRLRVISRDEAAENPEGAPETGAGEPGKERRHGHQERRAFRQEQKRGPAEGEFEGDYWRLGVLRPRRGRFLSLPSFPQVSPELLCSKDSPSSRRSSSPKHKSGTKGAGSSKKEKKASLTLAVSETARYFGATRFKWKSTEMLPMSQYGRFLS